MWSRKEQRPYRGDSPQFCAPAELHPTQGIVPVSLALGPLRCGGVRRLSHWSGLEPSRLPNVVSADAFGVVQVAAAKVLY